MPLTEVGLVQVSFSLSFESPPTPSYFYRNTVSQLTQLPINKLRREVGPRCSFEVGSVYIVHLLAPVFTRADIRLVAMDPYPPVPTPADLQAIVLPKINTRRATKGSTAGIPVNPRTYKLKGSGH